MTHAAHDHRHYRSSVKETLISVIIAFALAFVFRGFVVEAFMIPTGSMAPTLMGAHMRFHDPRSGYDWPVGPWEDSPTGAAPIQGQRSSIRVSDPMTGLALPEQRNVPTRAGDRIFVMKYLTGVYDPERFDVVVFKNPTNPQVNFIKRLIGLAGEQVAIVDGDVFTRTPRPDDPQSGPRAANPWLWDGWAIAHKPERAQRALWQPVFDSRYTPRSPSDGRPFRPPWIPGTEGWTVTGSPDYRYEGSGPTTLAWDIRRPIRDYYPYNEGTPSSYNNARFPVSDLAIAIGVRPGADGQTVSMTVGARRHEFRADVSGDTATLRMRPAGGEWTILGKGQLRLPLRPGEVANLEFWHVDQTLQLWRDGELVVSSPYGPRDWNIDQRVANCTTYGEAWSVEVPRAADSLYDSARYVAPTVEVSFSAGPLTVHRLALARDVHYQADIAGKAPGERHARAGLPAQATHPSSVLTLGKDQFFCCGDNSPSSLDGRLWDKPDPWVAEIDPAIGVVHRDLLIGKAFFVYFPAPTWRGMIPIPDFGRMRFIW